MSHWYHPATGQLLDKVEYKDKNRKGLYRDATLADARPLNLYPSVTTILQLLDKPGLDKWKVEQAIKFAAQHDFTLDISGFSTFATQEDIAVVKECSEQYTQWAQDYGTAVHWWLNHKLRERQGARTFGIPPIMAGTEELAEATLRYLDANGFEFTHTERTVVHTEMGYAGTIDLLGTHYGEPCLVDLKTQDSPLTLYDPEHPLQLCAYDMALGVDLDTPPRKLLSLIADRTNVGQFKLHQWQDIDRYKAIWYYLVEVWRLIHKYDPRTVQDE